MSNIRPVLDELESLLGELGDAAFKSQGGAMSFRDRLKVVMENLKIELEKFERSMKMSANTGRRALIDFFSTEALQMFRISGTPCYCNNVVEVPEGLRIPAEYRGQIMATREWQTFTGTILVPWSNIRFVFWPNDPNANIDLPDDRRIGFRQEPQNVSGGQPNSTTT